MNGFPGGVQQIVARMVFDDVFDTVKAELLRITRFLGEMGSTEEVVDYGRIWIAEHNQRVNYALGTCKTCYRYWVVGCHYNNHGVTWLYCDYCRIND